MRLGVISDTHGHAGFARAAAAQLRGLKVDRLVHCGDVGSGEIVPIFAGWPVDYVVGNVDWDEEVLRAAVEAAGQTFHGEFGEIELEARRIAILHSHDAMRFEGAVASGRYDLVCYGHTHQAEFHLAGRTLVLNPGALYRATPKSFAVVDLPSLAVETHVLVV